MTPTSSAVDWLPWGRVAFERARAEHKPVLLSIVAPWSTGCAEMDRVSYADAGVVRAIHEGFVAIRVDADHRPDIADRYALGGLPTTAFLTPAGAVIGGGTYVPPDRLRAALITVASQTLPPDGPGAPPSVPAAAAAASAQADDAQLLELTFATFDETHAGFGSAPKFPHPAPVHLALDLHEESGDPLMLERAARTLDAMGWGGLYDEADGGFFRCAASDWSDAQAEKLLPVNAALLDLYLHGGRVASNERWFARAVDVVHFIERQLIAANGAWRFSPSADPGRQFSDSNALAASAMLHAARVFDDEALGKRAIEALERVLLSSYRPGHGVAHSAAGVRGLLTDQVAMASATLDAWESTGNIVYRMMGEELMHFAVRTLWDESGGGFLDRVMDDSDPAQGLLGVPLKPFVLNCEAAVVLRRLAEATNDAEFGRRAAETLNAVSGRAAAHGPQAAHYLLARRVVLR